jgi:hypothetical protein
MKQLHKTVVQDDRAHQRLLDVAAQADAREGIRQGLEQARSEKGRPVREFFAEFKTKHAPVHEFAPSDDGDAREVDSFNQMIPKVRGQSPAVPRGDVKPSR